MASEAQSLPRVKINVNGNYCLGIPPALYSGKEFSVDRVCNQDFVLTAASVNFVANNLIRPPQKKGVSPVKLKNVSIKDVNLVQSQSFSVCNSCFSCDQCCTRFGNLGPTL